MFNTPLLQHTKAIVREAEGGMAAKRRLPEAVWDSSKCLISDNPRFVRGDCGVCSKSVFSDDPCTKEKGICYHTECLKTRESSASSLQQMGDRGAEGVPLFFCNIPGCTREVWIGQKGEQCCRTCKASNGTSHGPDCEAKEARLAQRLAGINIKDMLQDIIASTALKTARSLQVQLISNTSWSRLNVTGAFSVSSGLTLSLTLAHSRQGHTGGESRAQI